MLQEIDHINIVVRDIEACTAFFSKIGFELEHEGDLEGDWISDVVGLTNVRARYAKLRIPNTGTALELVTYHTPPVEAESLPNQANRLGFRHIAFRVENIEDVVAKLKELEVELFSDIHTYEPTNKKLLYFYGPEEIILELCQYN